MSQETPHLDRRETWRPPPRPDWVLKVNAEGDCMDIRSVVPLDEASLLDAARRNTGLDDFGDDAWLPHFRFILEAMDKEADFNLLGRITARAHLLNILEGRLQIEDTYKQHPEIENEIIAKPIFIIGQGRSGTSVLQNILSSDPDNGGLLTWEAMYPVPPPEAATYATDARIAKADKFIKQWSRIVPETASVHEFSGIIPCECVQVTSYAFISQWFILLGQMTSYVDYMLQVDWREVYAYHKRVLKLLQWKNPRKRWLLKSPTHMRHLPALLATYPDASLVWPHRDPVKAVASVTNLAGNRNWVTSDRPRVTGYEEVTDPRRSAETMIQVVDWIEDGTIPKGRLCNVHYDDIVADPLKVTEEIYGHFGLTLSPAGRAGIDAYVTANPRTARPAHKYDAGSDEIVAYERRLFRRYTDYFSIQPEG